MTNSPGRTSVSMLTLLGNLDLSLGAPQGSTWLDVMVVGTLSSAEEEEIKMVTETSCSPKNALTSLLLVVAVLLVLVLRPRAGGLLVAGDLYLVGGHGRGGRGPVVLFRALWPRALLHRREPHDGHVVLVLCKRHQTRVTVVATERTVRPPAPVAEDMSYSRVDDLNSLNLFLATAPLLLMSSQTGC
jgi:hypothetical protein